MTDTNERLTRLEVQMDSFGDRLTRVESKMEVIDDKLDVKFAETNNTLNEIKIGMGKQDTSLGWLKKILVISLVAALGGTGGAKLVSLLSDSDVTNPAMAAPVEPAMTP